MKNKKRCPHCTNLFNKMGIATHMKHCKGVADQKIAQANEAILGAAGQNTSAASLTSGENWKSDLIEKPDYTKLYRECSMELKRVHSDNESLRRCISTQEAVITHLCKALIESFTPERRY